MPHSHGEPINPIALWEQNRSTFTRFVVCMLVVEVSFVTMLATNVFNFKAPSFFDNRIGFRLKLNHRRQVGLYRVRCPHFGVNNAVKWKPKLFDCPQTSKAVFAVGQAQNSLLSVCASVNHTLTPIKTIASIVSPPQNIAFHTAQSLHRSIVAAHGQGILLCTHTLYRP